MRKLISMVEFVLTDKYTATGHKNYANFLKQPLEIWQFVPCKLVDGDWMVLEEPVKYNNWTNYDYSGTDIGFEDEKLCREYQEAKSRCIFDGFEFLHPSFLKSKTAYIIVELKNDIFNFKLLHDINNTDSYIKIIKTIEDLVKYNLELTASAIKELVLQE
ncbi:MAG TPA: hypothetical protein VJ780_06215 [Flavobacterium sp.]|nr:hypothetical protein [Flavobacterium sp.]